MDKQRLQELAGVQVNEEVERLQVVKGWDIEIDGEDVIIIQDSKVKCHMDINEWTNLIKKFNKIQKSRD